MLYKSKENNIMFFNDDMGETAAPETQEDVTTQAPVSDDAVVSEEAPATDGGEVSHE